MTQKVSYCIAAYFGERNNQNPEIKHDPLYYIKQQLIGLEKQTIRFNHIYIICKFDEASPKDAILSALKALCAEERFIIQDRENLGGSYSSWAYALNHLDQRQSDFVFLVEDDHILQENNATETLLDYFKKDPDILYLCQFWTSKPYHWDWEGQQYAVSHHAALSCGIMNIEQLKKADDQCIGFRLLQQSGYKPMWINQAQFLEDFRLNGYKITSWSDDHSAYYIHNDIEHGNPDGMKMLVPLG